MLFLNGAGGIADLEFYFADLVINLYSMGGAGATMWLTLPYKNKRDRALAAFLC